LNNSFNRPPAGCIHRTGAGAAAPVRRRHVGCCEGNPEVTMQNKPKQQPKPPVVELDAEQLALVSGGHTRRALKARGRRGRGSGRSAN
jgi:hypothetical protein